MKRLFDILFALALLPVLLIPATVIAMLIKMSSPGPVLHWSDRVGRYNRIFRMPKFRTMKLGTPDVATHLLDNADARLIRFGSFLRRTSLDEIPQIYSILIGDMSFVGPRPALFNQHDLIALRSAHGIDRVTPGLTGWAQVNGRDDIPIPLKVELDAEYAKKSWLGFDIYIIGLTLLNVVKGKGISH